MIGTRQAPAPRWREVVALLGFGDMLVTTVAMAFAIVLWSFLPTEFLPGPFFPHWIAASILAWIVALGFVDGYNVVAPTFWRSSLAAVARALAILLLLTAAVFFVLPFFFPRGVGALAPFVVAIALLAWRSLFLYVARAADLSRRILVLGTDEASIRVAQLLLRGPVGVSYRPVAFLSGAPDGPSEILGLPVRRSPDSLWDVVRDLDVDEVVVGAEPEVAELGRVALVECFARGIVATSAVGLYEALSGRVMAASLGTAWYTQIPTEPNRPYLVIKRAIDIVAVVLTAPLTLTLGAIVSLAVRLGSGSPVFYRQVRLGERGVPYVIHKFRTMQVDAEANGARFATHSDPRRTALGRLLRRSRLDEIPQLWDVLAGHMSLIGPRPERPEFIDRLRESMPLYEARSLVRPGLTGWAQVRLPYASDLDESLIKLEYDLYYVKHVGPLLDLSIALRTLAILFRFAGR